MTQFAIRRGSVILERTANAEYLARLVDDPRSEFYNHTIVSRQNADDAWSVDPDYNYR